MNQEEIERGFANAGWELDGSFYKHLVIGCTDGLSILAYFGTRGTQEGPEFQLCDLEKDLTYRVREIPPPAGRQAARRTRTTGGE